MSSLIHSRAPVRISFAGGGTDVSPYPEERGGCVLSATINKYSFTSLRFTNSKKISLAETDNNSLMLESIEDAVLDGNFDLAKTVIMEMNPKTGLELFFRNDVPPRSGLGSSAAAFVSIIGAFNLAFGKKLSRHEIAQLAFEIERNRLGVKGGKQDQFASSYGGLNFIEFIGKNVKVSSMNVSKSTLLELEKNLLLVFVGERKMNGTDIISDQVNSFVLGNKQVCDALDSAKSIAIDMKTALKKGDLEQFGKLLDKGWFEKKKYSKNISNPFIDKIYSAALNAGAIGGKLTGAGGGGYMIFYCYPDKEINVKNKLVEIGVTPINFSFDFKGVQAWNLKVGKND